MRSRVGLRRLWLDVPLRTKGLVVITLPLVAVLVTAAAMWTTMQEQREVRHASELTENVQHASEHLLQLLLDAETGVRGYLLSGDERFLEPYELALRRLGLALDRLRNMRQSYVRGRITTIEELIEQRLAVLASLRQAGTSSSPADRTALMLTGRAIMESLRSELGAIGENARRDLRSQHRQADRVERNAAFLVGASIVLGLGGGALAVMLFTSGVVRRVGAVEANAQRLETGVALLAPTVGHDEVGRLAGAVERAAELLRQRDDASRDAREQAERANRAKNEFLSRMSHELRTPLNAVLGFAQLLELEQLRPDQRESVSQITKGGRHLLELINEVLDIARIETGELKLSLEPVPLADVVADVLALIRPMAASQNVNLPASVPEACREFVRADRQRLKQVLLNLVANAVKYNREGGTVSCECRKTGTGRVLLSVSDTGIGIAREHLSLLFTPFERLGAEASGVEGTGLGLALTKRLVEAMGAHIDADSELGRGSTFLVDLEAALPPIVQLPEREHEDAKPPASERAARSVLYIEDNLSNVKLVERILSRRPEISLLVAMQARLGLELAREHQPALVLLDLNLPDMAGEEALRRLRADPRTATIPVVVISADATAGQVQRLRRYGASDYLTKPFDVSRFLAAVDRLAPAGGSQAPLSPAPDEGQTEDNPLDRAVIANLRSLGGGEGGTRELIDVFLREAPSRIDALRAAIAAGDMRSVKEVAHGLRGSSATFAAWVLAERCERLEAQASTSDGSSLHAGLGEVEHEFERARSALLHEFATAHDDSGEPPGYGCE